jgi:hypothetical protein
MTIIQLHPACCYYSLRTYYTINPVSSGSRSLSIMLLLGGGGVSPPRPGRPLGRLRAGLTPGLAGSSLRGAALTVRLLAATVNLQKTKIVIKNKHKCVPLNKDIAHCVLIVVYCQSSSGYSSTQLPNARKICQLALNSAVLQIQTI